MAMLASTLDYSPIANQLAAKNADICVVARDWSCDIDSLVQAAPVADQRFKVPALESRALVEKALADFGLAVEPLVEDIEQMCRLFGQLFQQQQVELRLDVTDQQSCPKFHCDNVFVRLLVTYCGPGTEYIHVRDPQKIMRAGLGELVFLKGHKHPTYGDEMLHRSPDVPRNKRRFCIAINFDDWLEDILAENQRKNRGNN